MGRMHAEIIHAHLPEGGVHPLADLLGRHAQILRCEGHVVLHHVGDDLVVRILEDHAHGAADVQELVLVGGVHVPDPDLAGGGQEDGVHVLEQSGFAGAVVAQHGHEAALGDLQAHAAEDLPLPLGVGEVYVFKTNDRFHMRQMNNE